MNYVVGDIHGEITKLETLINNILEQSKNPIFTFIGDYLDKGENPKAALDYLVGLNQKYQCNFILGNHEFLWLSVNSNNNAKDYLIKYGAISTIKSFGFLTFEECFSFINNNYKSIFENLLPYYFIENYLIVHSGIAPKFLDKSIKSIPVESFLFNRYDFLMEERLYCNKFKIIFGHTGFYFPFVDQFKIGIDTAACFLEGQPLTAFCPEADLFINSNNEICSINTFDKFLLPNIPRNKPWRQF